MIDAHVMTLPDGTQVVVDRAAPVGTGSDFDLGMTGAARSAVPNAAAHMKALDGPIVQDTGLALFLAFAAIVAAVLYVRSSRQTASVSQNPVGRATVDLQPNLNDDEVRRAFLLRYGDLGPPPALRLPPDRYPKVLQRGL